VGHHHRVNHAAFFSFCSVLLAVVHDDEDAWEEIRDAASA
jgi:hypothetical protein